jgi:ATP-dependent Clp protease ATP-binding subunit ClpC
MEKHNASRLTGSPPGFVGYEEGGELTEKIRKNPYRVLLFDEIEKAHRDVFNLLLSVLEEGELHDNLGHTVSFRNTVIIMTSNIGAKEISGGQHIGFSEQQKGSGFNEIKSAVQSEVRQIFNPEFLNRLDEVIVFHPLDCRQIQTILGNHLDKLCARVYSEYSITLVINAPLKKWLLEKVQERRYGAREVRRVLQKELEDSLSQCILRNMYSAGTKLYASLLKGAPHFSAVKRKSTGTKNKKDLPLHES